MPCCGAEGPAKGFKTNESQDPADVLINHHLALSAYLVKKQYQEPLYDQEAWFKEWEKAFSHHLRGCDERS